MADLYVVEIFGNEEKKENPETLYYAEFKEHEAALLDFEKADCSVLNGKEVVSAITYLTAFYETDRKGIVRTETLEKKIING